MKKIQVGWIQNTHGIKGELKVRSETDFPNIHFKKGKKLYLDDQKELLISSSRLQKEMYLLQFVGYQNINLVQDWKGKGLYIDQNDQVHLKKGEYYRHQLIGLSVISEKGSLVGTILAVEETEKKEVLYPFIPSFIDRVDQEERKVYVNRWEEFQ